jgi:hypothetical protein
MKRSIRELTDVELKDRERRLLIALGQVRAEQERRKRPESGSIELEAATPSHAVS